TLLGQNLLHSSGVLDADVSVIDALDLSGTFLLKAPPSATEQTLVGTLQRVPGFVFVADYTPASGPDEEEDGELIDEGYYENTFGPFDYTTFLTRERNGEFPSQGGAVDPSLALDKQTNNNTVGTGPGRSRKDGRVAG